MKTPHHHPRFCTHSCFLLSLRTMTEDHTSLVLEHRFPPTLIYVCFMKIQRTVLTSFRKSACTGDCIMVHIPLHNTTDDNIVVYLFLDCRPYSGLRYGKDYIGSHMQTTARACAPMRRAEASSLPRPRCKHRLQTPPQRPRHHIVPLDLLYAHMYPFHNECRAVGRIIQAGLNGKVAVRCHGYLTVPATMEEGLEQRFHIAA